MTAKNKFQTARYDTRLEEEFVSPDNWLPGEKINKDVWVENKSSIPIFVKMIIRQEWIRLQNVLDLDGNVIAPAAGEKIPLVFETEGLKEYAAQISWGEQVVLLASGKSSEVHLGLPLVDKVEDAVGKWLLISEEPDQNDNYILYYIGMIDAKGKSPLTVDSVTMNANIRPAILEKVTTYDKETEKWITTALTNGTYDYENAEYAMFVTVETVQATADAVKTVFAAEEDNEKIVTYLASYAMKNADTEIVETKKLYFEEVNGTMTWNPVKGSEGNWFMNFTNMVPGGKYEDYLQIENGSQKTYKLYMQTIPIEQDEKKDELLERIRMHVWIDGKEVYSGTASGKEYDNGTLQNAIYLGTYEKGSQSQVKVQLELDENLEIEYSDKLTRSDWKFMVTEVKKSTSAGSISVNSPQQILQPPKTGDTSNREWYQILLVISILGILITGVYRKRRI